MEENIIFNPEPETLTLLFTTQLSLSSFRLPSHLTLLTFLSKSSLHSSLPYRTSLSTASSVRPHRNDAASSLSNNLLQLLRCPGTNKTIVFFPTGINADQVGYAVLPVTANANLFKSNKQFNHPISRLSVSKPISNLDSGDSIGYLFACTLNSIYWFSVKLEGVRSESQRPRLIYLHSKVFKTCSIVCAQWNPHKVEESVVLLENGELFLFDMDTCLKDQGFYMGTKLEVNWGSLNNSEDHKWLSCEFGSHCRSLIVARSDSVFLLDFGDCAKKVICLANTGTLRKYPSAENEQFVALCKAGGDGSLFVLASNSSVLLCDTRECNFVNPVLWWGHTLKKPCYIDVLSLCELRSQFSENEYNVDLKSGCCIVLGSFWTNDFILFCYGPLSRDSRSLHKWGLPSELSLSGRDGHCGSSMVREEFLKDSLPPWIDWQLKKEIVLGFGIINNDVTQTNEFDGFTMIRLVSTGKLESQRYRASRKFFQKLEEVNKEVSLNLELNFPCFSTRKYEFSKRFTYLELNYLCHYLNGNLVTVLDGIMEQNTGTQENESFSPEFHIILCEKLKACGFGRLRSSLAVVDTFNDISLPTSIHEVALKRIWAELRVELLQLAFSSYSELLEVFVDREVSLEFLVVPERPQLPPFLLRTPSCRSNKWSHKEFRLYDTLVGPLLPLYILLTLRDGFSIPEEQAREFSPESEVSRQCMEIMQVASEMAVSSKPRDTIADDGEKMSIGSQKAKPFLMYHPVQWKCFTMNSDQDNSICEDEKSGAMICKMAEKEANKLQTAVRQDLFVELSPINMNFDHVMTFGSKEFRSYSMLSRQFANWQKSFELYKDFIHWEDSQSKDLDFV